MLHKHLAQREYSQAQPPENCNVIQQASVTHFLSVVNGSIAWLQIQVGASEMTELEDNNCSGVRGLICVTKGRMHVSPTRGSAKADCKQIGHADASLKERTAVT